MTFKLFMMRASTDALIASAAHAGTDSADTEGETGPEMMIDIGGFLGLGEYTVALPLSEFEHDAEMIALFLPMNEETLDQRPEIAELALTREAGGVEPESRDTVTVVEPESDANAMGAEEVEADPMEADEGEAATLEEDDESEDDTTTDNSARVRNHMAPDACRSGIRMPHAIDAGHLLL